MTLWFRFRRCFVRPGRGPVGTAPSFDFPAPIKLFEEALARMFQHCLSDG